MIDIEKPKIEIAEISDDNRYGKFICEPLERGYGTTFGNSLRRMLLSSTPAEGHRWSRTISCALCGNAPI